MKKQILMSKLVILTLGVLLFAGGAARAGYVDIYQDTVINNNIATDSTVRVYNSAQITVWATDYVNVELLDTSAALVYGGNASYRAYSSSTLNLYGGDFSTRSPSVGYEGSLAKIYVYGENFVYQPAGGFDGFLSGNWLNGTSFNIYFRGLPQSFEQSLGTNIFLVPEPLTLFFMLGGIFGVRKLKH